MKINQQFFLFLIIIISLSKNAYSQRFRSYKREKKEDPLKEPCETDDNQPFRISIKDYKYLKAQKFEFYKIKDLNKKPKRKIKMIKKKVYKSIESIPEIKEEKIEHIIYGNKEDHDDFNSEVEKDRSQNKERIEELEKLKDFDKRLNQKISKVHKEKPEIILKMHLLSIKEFFDWLVKGFNKIKTKYYEVMKNKMTVYIEEHLRSILTCENFYNISIDYHGVLELKNAIRNIDYKQYKKSMLEVNSCLRKITNLIEKQCSGIGYLIDVFDKFITNIKENEIRPDYLINLNLLKDKAVLEMEKHSFNEAGYTLGKIYSEAKKYSCYLCYFAEK